MTDELCAYCGLHIEDQMHRDGELDVPACLRCLAVVFTHKPVHQFVSERKAWVREMRGIPEQNVTVIHKAWQPTPFRMKRKKKWTRSDRERLRR